MAGAGATVVGGTATGEGTAIATPRLVSITTFGSSGLTAAGGSGVLVAAVCVGAAGNAGASAIEVVGAAIVEPVD